MLGDKSLAAVILWTTRASTLVCLFMRLVKAGMDSAAHGATFHEHYLGLDILPNYHNHLSSCTLSYTTVKIHNQAFIHNSTTHTIANMSNHIPFINVRNKLKQISQTQPNSPVLFHLSQRIRADQVVVSFRQHL